MNLLRGKHKVVIFISSLHACVDKLKYWVLILSVVRSQQDDIAPEHITPSQVGKYLPECTKTRRPASVCEVSRIHNRSRMRVLA